MSDERDVVVYSAEGVDVAFPLDRERETVWATQAQIEELFGVNQSGVSRHIRNVFRDAEVDQESNMQKMHIAHSDRPTTLYSLDVILAVGYRANSSRAIEFRRWASGVLKQYMLDGIAVNERRLEELGAIVQILARSQDELMSGVATVLANYLPGLQLLRQFDEDVIEIAPGTAPAWTLTIEEARDVIRQVSDAFPRDRLFGREWGNMLEAVIAAIYQQFGGHDSIQRRKKKPRTCCISSSRTTRLRMATNAAPLPCSSSS